MAQTDVSTAAEKVDEPAQGWSALLYDRKARGLFFQIALLLLVAYLVYSLIDNTITNLAALDKRFGFGFLGDTAGFQILTTPGTSALDYTIGESTYLDVFLVGVVNTLVVAFTGIICATFLGFVLGVFRLSQNMILSGFGTAYVELFRNTPLLLQMLFIYSALLAFLPAKRGDPLALPFGWSLDQTGLWGWAPLPQAGFWIVVVALIATLVFWIAFSFVANGIQAKTGKRPPVFLIGLGLFIGVPLILFLILGSPLDWEEPTRSRFGFRDGAGVSIKSEMIAVFLALTLYTASFIAEIVRAGILAVNKGQSEASFALGMRAQPTLNLIIIPQALRVIIPPLTSQFLNLTKNSSLAVAIAYPDVVSVFAGTALNQVGQEIEMIFMMMMVYLFFSIVISIVMNWYNKRIALIER
ncbi:MAG: ABC transporter permease subunit [Pseudomonadota bacterium]